MIKFRNSTTTIWHLCIFSTFIFFSGDIYAAAAKKAAPPQASPASKESKDKESEDKNKGKDAKELGTPSHLDAKAVSESQINLTWQDRSDNETGFKILRKIGNGASGIFTQVAIVGANITAYSDKGLIPNTGYSYRVQAFNAKKVSPVSKVAMATTKEKKLNPPAAPTNLVATAISDNEIDITWEDRSNNETAFLIERKGGACHEEGVYEQIAVLNSNITTYSDTRLQASTEYFYRVRATNSAGNSAYSNEASATTKRVVIVAALDGGYFHSVGLRNDGTVWTWGGNAFGQLGNGTMGNNVATPSQVNGLSNVMAVAAGGLHTVALKTDGSLWSWGYNYCGQLGDGTKTSRSTPVQVICHDVIAISGGGCFTLALKSDGTVWSWGQNIFGQLGDKTTVQRLTPVQVVGLSNVIGITAGPFFSAALKADGTVWAWGMAGELGIATLSPYSAVTSPVQVKGLSNIIDVAADSGGGGRIMALRSDGTVWTSGDNWYGSLGNGTTQSSYTPVQVSITDVVAVADGSFANLALKADGTLWTWGDYALSPEGKYFLQKTPAQVAGLPGQIVGVSTGQWHRLVLMADGSVYAWGYNTSGQVGDGTITSVADPDPYVRVPVQVKGLDLILDK